MTWDTLNLLLLQLSERQLWVWIVSLLLSWIAVALAYRIWKKQIKISEDQQRFTERAYRVDGLQESIDIMTNALFMELKTEDLQLILQIVIAVIIPSVLRIIRYPLRGLIRWLITIFGHENWIEQFGDFENIGLADWSLWEGEKYKK